tara:strand:- start:666 stop:1727 length:1062 start_codon:yes stop_codon:yes gene_type:complete
MKLFKKYTFKLIVLIFIFFNAIVFINYFIDPLNIYGKKKDKNEISKILLKTEYGISFYKVPFNLRDLKISLIKHAKDFDCIVIGSSKIQLISSLTKTSPKNFNCKKILNLFVEVATIEDIFIFSYFLIDNNDLLDKKIFLNIDPWTFNYNRNNRWKRYETYFHLMQKKINFDYSEETFISNFYNKTFELINIINLEYFFLSIQSLKNENKIIPVEKFDLTKGYKTRVVLPDGSYLYPSSFNKKKNKFEKYSNYYIVENVWYDQRAVNDFIELLNYLNNQYEIRFILTPYHHNIWNNYQPTTQAMIETENIVKDISNILSVDIVGSFNPEKFNCDPNEFYDEMHVRKECLIKIY